MNETAGQGGILCIGQFTAAGALVDVSEVVIAATDQTFDSNQALWGLTAGTDKAAKAPVVVQFTRHATTSTLRLWMAATDGGAWYARVQTLGVPGASPSAVASGGPGPLPAGAATAARQDTGNTTLAAIKGQAGNVLVAKGTWVDISTITGRLAILDGNTVTTPNTATGALYGSSDGGVTTCWLMTDWTGDPIQGRVLTAHTVAHPLGTSYRTSIGFVKGAATSVQWKQSAQTADNWVWRAVGQ